MKKFLKYLFVLLVAIVPITFASAEEETTTTSVDLKDPVKVYVFYGEGCDYCASLRTWINSLTNDADYAYKFKLVELEVWNNDENATLMTNVASYFNFNLKGVPFVVVGDQYTTGYTEDSTPETIMDYIDEEYANDSYIDVVDSISGGKILVTSDKDETEEDKSSMSTRVAYVLIGIFAIIVIAIVYASLSEKKEQEIERKQAIIDEVEKMEEEKEAKTKPSTKKATTKSTSTKKTTTKKKSSAKKTTTTKKVTKGKKK